ncbi:SPOR domain-containing protein [Methylobacterium sp. A54F]
MTNASRAPVDFEAFARELEPPVAAAPGAQAHVQARAGKADPLAELARIVGQDDPFRALLAARDGRRGPEAPEAAWQGRTEPRFSAEDPERNATPADAFNQYLASVEQQFPAEAAYAAAPEVEAPFEGRELKRVRPRRRLLSVGAGVAVLALSVAGALTYKGTRPRGADGGVPVIQADASPLKVAPKTADGVEIPDQNKQIYEPKARDSQIRIVNREEQPLDVAQAARAAQAGETGSTTPGASGGTFSDALGEPRRVRTVSVKSDGPPRPEAQAQATPAETATPASVIPTMTLPTDEPAPAPKARPLRQAALPQPAPVEAAPAQPALAESRPAAEAKPPRKALQRVASVSPEAGMPIEPPTTAATSAPAVSSAPALSNAPVSGFSVQLGVRGSAAEAQTALRQLQAKYSQLSGQPELIRQAEVGGKTIFRVRVGPLAKEKATSLCGELQGAGAPCFVAKN